MKEELRYKSYAMRKGQFMSEATKNRRLPKAKKLLVRLKHPLPGGDDQAGDGQPRQGHSGEGLPPFPIQD